MSQCMDVPKMLKMISLLLSHPASADPKHCGTNSTFWLLIARYTWTSDKQWEICVKNRLVLQQILSFCLNCGHAFLFSLPGSFLRVNGTHNPSSSKPV